MSDSALRQEIVETCRAMNALGVNQGMSGNLSVRSGKGFLLTPSGLDYSRLMPEDVVSMDLEGGYASSRIPSSEWRIHRDVLLSRPEVNVVMHAHPMYCTTLAIHGRSIPAVQYLIGLAGVADIRCAPYETPATQALSDVALVALADRRACLLAHHGAIAVGETPAATLALLVEVENLAEQYWRALQLGDPPVLGEAEMSEMLGILGTYGSQPDFELRSD